LRSSNYARESFDLGAKLKANSGARDYSSTTRNHSAPGRKNKFQSAPLRRMRAASGERKGRERNEEGHRVAQESGQAPPKSSTLAESGGYSIVAFEK
jgi:hypothetical protein